MIVDETNIDAAVDLEPDGWYCRIYVLPAPHGGEPYGPWQDGPFCDEESAREQLRIVMAAVQEVRRAERPPAPRRAIQAPQRHARR